MHLTRLEKMDLKKKLKLNLKIDKKDKRDYEFKDYPAKVYISELPKKVDLRPHLNEVGSQSSLGSCSGWAYAAAMEFLFTKRTEYKYKTMLSPLHLYYHERVLMGTVEKDSGAYLRDGCKVLQKTGIAMERFWPYRIEKFATEPGIGAELSAGFFQANSYWRAYTLDEIKEALANEKAVVIGAKIFSNISKAWTDGIIRMPGTSDYIGSHAMTLAGYDDENQWFIVRNSWGSNWGDEGYAYIPYKYMPYIHDIWVLV